MEAIIFYFFAGLMVVSALLMLFTKNVLYAAFLTIITFLSVAAIYVFLYADFVAVTQVLVYVGGILVLLIFGIMLTNRMSGKAVITGSHNIFSGILIGFSLLSLIIYLISLVDFSSLAWINDGLAEPPVTSTISRIGVLFMSDFMLPFEITAILLLIALIGSAYVAKKEI